MITRKVIDSMTLDHGRRVRFGNCMACLLEHGVQNRTNYSEGNAWLCEDHK
jgi:hypothetical protein